MDGTDSELRLQLISTLWALKQAFERQDDPGLQNVRFVHFNMLLKDEAYRRGIVEMAKGARSAEIRRLGHEVALLDAGAEISPVPPIRAAQVESHQARAATPERPPAARADPRQARLGPPEPTARKPRIGSQLLITGAGLVLIVAAVGAFAAKQGGVFDESNPIPVPSSIYRSMVWQAGNVYRLNGQVFVEGGATLTIEPGVRVLGAPGSALVVTRDARIYARGTRDKPIVFTSAAAPGQRHRGDWSGLVLLGNAPVNSGVGHIEGLPIDDARGTFGGNDPSSNCGVLQYVRVEFAGYEIGADNELNGLTLGGCGQGTVLRHLQVHMGFDDGIEFFGGSANLSHVVISRPGDDGLDWDAGWTGSGQFIIVQQGPDAGDNAIEADNRKGEPDALPRSRPTLSNLTLVGANSRQVAQRGMLLRRGTGADLRNVLITGFGEAVDLRGRSTGRLVATGELRMQALLFGDKPPLGDHFADETAVADDDDGGFNEETFLSETPGTVVARAPVLTRSVYNTIAPDFTPPAGSTAVKGVSLPEGEFWDEAANYIGAVRPGSRTTWLAGWTAFPQN